MAALRWNCTGCENPFNPYCSKNRSPRRATESRWLLPLPAVLHRLCHIWKFDLFLSVRSFKTGGHRSVHRRLAHLLQQRPVAKNGGELLPSCFCPQLWNMQCCIQVQFGKVSISVCRSWPVRCFTCGSTSLFSPSPSSSSHSPFGCCSRCSHWPPSTNGCSEGRTLCVSVCVWERECCSLFSQYLEGWHKDTHSQITTDPAPCVCV